MRIGIDARELLGRPTGVGRYLRSLLGQWAVSARAGTFPHRIVMYAPQAWPADAAAEFAGLDPECRIVAGSSGTWWEQTRLPAAASRDGLDVFFAPAYTSPLALACPVVQTIHDLSFLAHPEWFARRERIRRRLVTHWSARRARIVLTDSHFSAREIHERLGVPAHKIRTIPLGATRPGAVGDEAPALPGFDLRAPVVLYVGSIFNRRRVPDLIRAFARIAGAAADARLEIVGENRTHPLQDLETLCRELGVASRVSIRAYVSDAELASLYASARVFVFLSEYEGFGLTPLEALGCGIPVVVLDTPVARETCGEAAGYVAPGDLDAVASLVARLLTDAAAHRQALAPAASVLARYRWSEAADSTRAALEEAAR
ncbi:MAG: glycosyltransferase family 1 protein [Acidobacteriota bacterium]